ncbi:MAG: DnaD domain protein [Clostridia bacterium]|nr:DnaD domain protein [Clostridia bacterium]
MRMKFQFGTDAVLLPASAAAHFDKATKKDIRILFELAAEPLFAVDADAACKVIAARLAVSVGEIDAALAFWRGTGVLVALEEGESAGASPVQATPAPAAAPAARVVTDRGMPMYSSEELSGVLERRKELAGLIDACQRTFGKIFNTGEVSTVAGMVDYLGFDGEYILLLLSHCVRMEKKSLRYAEKLAISLHDEGVTDVANLEERLHRIEMMDSAIGRIRTMFGIGSRRLSTKESRMVEKWVCGMQYPHEIINFAYEISVDATKGEPTIPYANAILERWYAEGYKTLDDVQKAIADYRRKKNNNTASFDVDDFFEAALKRTYGEQ